MLLLVWLFLGGQTKLRCGLLGFLLERKVLLFVFDVAGLELSGFVFPAFEFNLESLDFGPQHALGCL